MAYSPGLTVTVAGIAGAYIFVWALLLFTQDAREPPSVADGIPFISPIIGMTKHGGRFHKLQRDKHKLPVHTLRLPGSRLYVINDTSLIPVVQKQVRTLTFAPLLVRFVRYVMEVSPKGQKIMSQDHLEHDGVVHQMSIAIARSLAPGPNLDDLNKNAVDVLNTSLSALSSRDDPVPVKMFDWASHEIMMATTNAIYGPLNPFKDPAVQAAYFKLEGGLVTLMTGFMPSLLAKESRQARKVMEAAFLKYLEAGGLDNGASAYARDRCGHLISNGVPILDVAKAETGGSIGLITNTMPATFWTLYHAFQDQAVLEKCRGELVKAVQKKDGESYLDLAFVKSSCPTIVSMMQETFRYHTVSMAVKAVVEDHLLDGRYLLKKGGTVLIPGTVQHSSSVAWGEDVDSFRHDRFVKQGKAASGNKYNPVAFRAFGGGANLCPGRHFASTEILAFASLILLRFDIRPVAGGSWDTAGFHETNSGFRLPKRDIEVELIPTDNQKWHVLFSEGGKPMDISE